MAVGRAHFSMRLRPPQLTFFIFKSYAHISSFSTPIWILRNHPMYYNGFSVPSFMRFAHFKATFKAKNFSLQEQNSNPTFDKFPTSSTFRMYPHCLVMHFSPEFHVSQLGIKIVDMKDHTLFIQPF